jgi:apolipoprotein N-acyltransferase
MLDDRNYDIFNSSFLFGAEGIRGTYRKRHLVPFGEYVPLESRIPFLKRFAPAGFSCEPGRGSAVFEIPTLDGKFKVGALICFEDAFPSLARESVRDGADILATLANDSWFGGSAEGEQHLAQAVLRCVENGRPMMRATNRGVSAFIDSHGRITRRVGGEDGESGFAMGDLSAGMRQTLYTRFGDWPLNMPCAAALLAFIVWRMRLRTSPCA